MRIKNIFFVLLIFSAMICSCKKKPADELGPEVVWLEPSQGDIIFTVDTFAVKATVTDDRVVRRIKVSLTNSQGTSLANMGDEFPNTSAHELNRFFYLDRRDISGGQLFLNLVAFDDENQTSVFREVTVVPIPIELRGTAVAYGSGNNRFVGIVDDNVLQNLNVSAGDITTLYGSHLHDNLLVVTGGSGKVVALRYPDFEVAWEHSIPNNSALRAIESTSFNRETGELLVGDTDQFFQIVNASGNVIAGFNTNLEQHQPVKCLLTSQRIAAIERKTDNSNQEFSVFFRSSGALEFRVGLPGDVLALFPHRSSQTADTEDQVAIFVNDNGNARIRIYDYANFGLTDAMVLPSGEMSAVCKIAPRRYLLQIGSTIYHINFNGPVQIYYTGEEFHELIFDEMNNRILALNDNGMFILGLSGGGLQQTGFIPVSDAVHAAVLYNRNPF